jgi:hypothetical protein
MVRAILIGYAILLTIFVPAVLCLITIDVYQQYEISTIFRPAERKEQSALLAGNFAEVDRWQSVMDCFVTNDTDDLILRVRPRCFDPSPRTPTNRRDGE